MENIIVFLIDILITDDCETHYNACQKQWFVDECQKEMELEEYNDD